MPIKQAAKKYLRASGKRHVQNVKIKESFRESIKKLNELVKSGDIGEVKKYFPSVQKALDKAAKSGVIKKNTASRKKSRLAAMIRKSSK